VKIAKESLLKKTTKKKKKKKVPRITLFCIILTTNPHVLAIHPSPPVLRMLLQKTTRNITINFPQMD
jgi:hypothetical protein